MNAPSWARGKETGAYCATRFDERGSRARASERTQSRYALYDPGARCPHPPGGPTRTPPMRPPAPGPTSSAAVIAAPNGDAGARILADHLETGIPQRSTRRVTSTTRPGGDIPPRPGDESLRRRPVEVIRSRRGCARVV